MYGISDEIKFLIMYYHLQVGPTRGIKDMLNLGRA
jgi:hypothetical protein